jgi:hypothetical protein
MMLSGETMAPEPEVRARRPMTATRELLFAMATPPMARSEALWPTWLSPLGASWKRSNGSRTHPTENRSE